MTSDPNTSGSHWTRHAAQWGKVGSPLRPVDEDVELYWRAVTASLTESELAEARALLLGVTPELTSMPWPAGASLIACDNSLAMLQHIWPLGHFPGSAATALNADWLSLPLAPGACDLVIGDGSLSVFDSADNCRRCALELHRVLQPGGCVVLRLFCPPRLPESPEEVLADLRQRRVGNFHAFKWRLVMAMHASNERASLADIWSRWESAFPNAEMVASLSGWQLETIRTLEAYRNASARYGFYTVDEVRSMLSPEFEFLAVAWPRYELGDRCPIVSFRRSAA